MEQMVVEVESTVAELVAPVETGERTERAPGGKRGETGMHMGKLSPELRRNRIAKNARNRSRRGDGAKKPCSSYEGCNHRKHGKGK